MVQPMRTRLLVFHPGATAPTGRSTRMPASRSGVAEPLEGGVTRLLQQSANGDTAAEDELFQLRLPTLRQMAAARMAREKPGHTLGPTALVNEAFLRLAHQYKVPVANTEQFLGVFGLTMRRVLVDHWKKRHAMKGGGSLQRVPIDDTFMHSRRNASACLDTLRVFEPAARLTLYESAPGGLLWDARLFGCLGPR